MEIILKDYVKGLGEKNDIVIVKNGYGRNYLIPQGLALIATSSAKKMAAENVKQASHKMAKVREDAQAMADRLQGLKLTVVTKAGSNGKIFGSVTTIQLAQALAEKGYEVDKRKISAPDIKNLGEYTASIDLHKEVKVEIEVRITNVIFFILCDL
jgi:large subunit ribosomal protein L9